MASVSDAECAALFINARDAIVARTTMNEIGYPQQAIPMQIDNSIYDGILNCKMQQKISKEMDMCFYWTRDREKLKTL